MSYLKGLTSKDVIVSPLTVHKEFSVAGTPPSTSPTNGPFFVNGVNQEYEGNEGTGSFSLVFNSIKHLYYGNYISSSNGLINTASLPQYNLDGTIDGPILNNLYENNISSINELRYWNNPAILSIFSIPRKQFGDYIKPGSYSDSSYYDDGEGNIRQTTNDDWKGNILYGAGVVIIPSSYTFPNPSWKSSYTLFETQYKCTIEASEFNYSLNPSLLSSSILGQNKILGSGSAQYADFVTGSYFTPYVTTVGLYNDNKELVAVGKLSQPLPLSQHVDTTILVNIDR